MNHRLLRLPEVIKRVGYCRASIYNKIADGTFPAAIKMSQRSSAWLESEIDAWIQSRIDATRGTAD